MRNTYINFVNIFLLTIIFLPNFVRKISQEVQVQICFKICIMIHIVLPFWRTADAGHQKGRHLILRDARNCPIWVSLSNLKI